MVVKDIHKLSHQELIDAMVNTMGCGYPPIDNEMRKYYSLLSREDLIKKAEAETVIVAQDKPVVTSVVESKRRQILESRVPVRPPRVTVSKNILIPNLGIPDRKEDEIVYELMRRSWIKDAVEIAPGCIGVKLDGVDKDTAKRRMGPILKQLNWEGEIVYHG